VSGVPPAILQAAARQVLAQWREDLGDPPAAAEVADLMVILATSILETQITSAPVIDPRAHSTLGQRLLELLRTEVVRGWKESGVADAELPPLLVAIERVREAIEPAPAQSFAAHLAGADGMELLVEVAHDLRSPLTSILFLAETLQRGQSGAVNDVQHRQLGLIYTAGLGLSSLASDLIELTRGGDQLVEKEPVPFSVTAVLESVRDIVRPMAEEKQLTVRLLPPARDERLGHPVALSRVLLNLTTNALKFTDQGYVEIVTQETGAERVGFAVRDSGKGIDPAIVSTLYQPLRRVVGRRGQLFSQTGLGLTICRKLVEAMGSELRVETLPGWGTRFFFELDLPPCLSRRQVAPPPPGPLRATRARARSPRRPA
jgi:signal transduction histidine kinase